MKTKRSNLGGARPGAGRPQKDTAKILISPPRDVAEAMQADKDVRKRGLDALVRAVRRAAKGSSSA